MLVVAELPVYRGLALCIREFDKNRLINPKYKGDWKEYEGKTINEIFPILGCTIFSQGVDVWAECLKILNNLNPKFFYWNGDQEALRIYSTTANQEYRKLKESIFACLPERQSSENKPKILHFKSRKRKPLMRQYAIASRII